MKGELCILMGFYLIWSPSIFAKKIEDPVPLARSFLQQSLQNYRAKHLEIPIKQETFLSMIKSSLRSEGRLLVAKEKFRLELTGNPSSLSIFDGQKLWHQPDKKEKIVFKQEKLLNFPLLSVFLDYQKALQSFEIQEFKKQKTSHTYKLSPKKDSPLESVYLKTDGRYIKEIRLNWKGLKHWQRYLLSKPLIKKEKAEEKLFVFQALGFKVIENLEI